MKLALLAVAAIVGGAASAPELPPLPRDGLVLQTKTGLRLATLGGRGISTVAGYRFAFECGYPDASAVHAGDACGRSTRSGRGSSRAGHSEPAASTRGT